MTYEKIRERYLKGYITDAQLQRFVDLGIITQEQYDELWEEKHAMEEAAAAEEAAKAAAAEAAKVSK